MAQQSIVDGGLDKIHLHFKVPTHNLEPGETTFTHLPMSQLKNIAKLQHIDLINPHKIDLSVHASASSHLGVSLSHGQNGEHPLNTHNRAVVVDHEKGIAEGYHTVSTGARVPETHTLHLHMSEEQKPEHSTMVLKRLDPKWADMEPHNATAGAFSTEIDGKEKVLIAPQSTAGVPSAMHRFLIHNEANTKLFGGKYSKAKRTEALAPNGHTAIVMDKADFDTTKKELVNSFTNKSPFQHGITASITNIGETAVNSKMPTFVNVTIHRTPVHPKDGIVAAQRPNPIGQADMHSLTTPSAKPQALPYTKAVELNHSDDTAAAINTAGGGEH